jgi:hypothetical protein
MFNFNVFSVRQHIRILPDLSPPGTSRNRMEAPMGPLES